MSLLLLKAYDAVGLHVGGYIFMPASGASIMGVTHTLLSFKASFISHAYCQRQIISCITERRLGTIFLGLGSCSMLSHLRQSLHLKSFLKLLKFCSANAYVNPCFDMFFLLICFFKSGSPACLD